MSRGLLWCGVAGPALFTAGWLVEGARRADFSQTRHWISQLALTDQGWVQVACFLCTGALIVAFACGLRRAVPTGAAATWGPRWIGLVGVGLMAAGIFVIDPGLGYPPLATPTQTWHGSLHDLAGLIVFTSLTAAAIVWSRRSFRRWALACAVVVAGCWVAASVLAALDYAGVLTPSPAGLAERVAISAGMAWTAGLAVRLLRARSAVAAGI